MSSTYIPSGKSSAAVVESLNDYISEELALPGNWSPILFYEDTQKFPCLNKLILARSVSEALRVEEPSYLDFFQKTRGYPHPRASSKLWNIFSKGSVMLYFEPTFLRLLPVDQYHQVDFVLLQYLEYLATQPIPRWAQVVERLGACNLNFFIQEPEAYAALIYRGEVNRPEEMTDAEMLKEMRSNLSPSRYSGKISLEDSRSDLIRAYQDWKKTQS